jgi:acyl carrier protein
VSRPMIETLNGLVQSVLKEPVEIQPDDNLFKLGIIDSVLLISLVEAIERDFKLTIGDRELVPDNFISLKRMETFITAKLAEQAGARG